VKSPLSAALAIGAGLVILLGYFLSLPILDNLRIIFLGWAITLAAIAAWVGVVNLLSVHWKKVSQRKPEMRYSLILVVAFGLTMLLGILELVTRPEEPLLTRLVNAVQFPVEASLLGVLAISLTYAGIRLLVRRKGFMAVVFFIATLIFLVLGSGVLALIDHELIPVTIAGLERLPLAGARGILLGIALGTLTTGVRVLIGTDRPYEGVSHG
jgi:hypothetical protein